MVADRIFYHLLPDADGFAISNLDPNGRSFRSFVALLSSFFSLPFSFLRCQESARRQEHGLSCRSSMSERRSKSLFNFLPPPLGLNPFSRTRHI